MPRPKSGNAMTSAERKVALRARRAERGESRRTVELTAPNATKADRIAAIRGISRTAAVNALVAEASEP